MAKLVDPDDLAQGTSVVIAPEAITGTQGTSGTIKLQPGQGNLIWQDGVTEQCIYSFLKEEWKSDANLIKYPFPMIAITEESMELTNGWNWADKTTKRHIRDGGWALKNSAGASKEEYANITTLGTFNDDLDRAYYVQSKPTSSGTPSGMFFKNEANEAVQIYGVTGYGHESDYQDNFVAFLREEQDKYAKYDLLTEQGISVLTYKKYAMPLSSSSDNVKITHTDAQIEASDDYTGIRVSYYTTAQSRTIGGTPYNFHIIIDGKSMSAEIIYEKVQYLLRQITNINSGPSSAAYPIRGEIADEILTFTGDTLATNWVGYPDYAGPPATSTELGWGGTYIDNYDADDINRLEFYDDLNTKRVEPYTATGSLLFNDNLTGDADAMYWMFFTSIGTSAYGTSDAWIVRETNSDGISGSVGAQSSIAFTFDYDLDDTGGESGVNHGRIYERAAAETPEDAPVTVVAIGLETAQFVKTTSTITRSTGNNISMVAALERNYSNPA